MTAMRISEVRAIVETVKLESPKIFSYSVFNNKTSAVNYILRLHVRTDK